MANSSANATNPTIPWSIPCDGDMAPHTCDAGTEGDFWKLYHLVMTVFGFLLVLDFVFLSLHLNLPKKLFRKKISWKNFSVPQRIYVSTGVCLVFTAVRHLGSYLGSWFVAKLGVFVMYACLMNIYCPYVFNYLVILEYSLHRWRQKRASMRRSSRAQAKVQPDPGADALEDQEEEKAKKNAVSLKFMLTAIKTYRGLVDNVVVVMVILNFLVNVVQWVLFAADPTEKGFKIFMILESISWVQRSVPIIAEMLISNYIGTSRIAEKNKAAIWIGWISGQLLTFVTMIICFTAALLPAYFFSTMQIYFVGNTLLCLISPFLMHAGFPVLTWDPNKSSSRRTRSMRSPGASSGASSEVPSTESSRISSTE